MTRAFPSGYRMRPCDYDDGYDDDPPPPIEEVDEPIEGPGNFTLLPVSNLLEHLETRLYFTPICESHIEIFMATALVEHAGRDFEIYPQFRLRRFRYDFAVFKIGTEKPIALIECDGAEWHSTPEQLRNDARKDIAAAEYGAKIIRFSGADIMRNPAAVARLTLAECRR